MIITICGSYKFKEEMMDIYSKLTDQGHIVLLPSINCNGHDDPEWYYNLHVKRIAFSDAIYVVDVGGYIGHSTRREIAATSVRGKHVYFYSEHDLDIYLEGDNENE